MNAIRVSTLLVLATGIIAVSIIAFGQAPTPTGPIMRFTATTANVSGAGDTVKIDLLKWSTDADRDQFVAAWNLTAPTTAARGGAAGGARGEAARGGGGGGARGGGRGGDNADAGAAGAAPPPAAAAAPAAAADANAPDAAAQGQGQAQAGGRGRGGAGGGGGRGGAAPAAAAPRTPEGSLAAALQPSQTVGYLWTSESAGYSLKYAYKIQSAGGDRIILATDRRLGVWNDLWKPTGNATVTPYDFSVIELRFPAKGDGEGKTSLSGKVTIDTTANTIALDSYATQPVIFKGVKRVSN
jgi:hypothetical protein